MGLRLRCVLSVLSAVLRHRLGNISAVGCTVCFQGVDSPLLDSARLGVFTMVAVVVLVIVAFGRWFVTLARLEADHQESDPQ